MVFDFDTLPKDAAYVEHSLFSHGKRVWGVESFKEYCKDDSNLSQSSISHGKYRILDNHGKLLNEFDVVSPVGSLEVNTLSTMLSWKCEQETVPAAFSFDRHQANSDDRLIIDFDMLKIVLTQACDSQLNEALRCWDDLRLRASLHWVGDFSGDSPHALPGSVELDLRPSIIESDSLTKLSMDEYIVESTKNNEDDDSRFGRGALASLMEWGYLGTSTPDSNTGDETKFRCGVSLNEITKFSSLLHSTSQSHYNDTESRVTCALVIELVSSPPQEESDDQILRENVVLSLVRIPCHLQLPVVSALLQKHPKFIASTVAALANGVSHQTVNSFSEESVVGINGFWFRTLPEAFQCLFPLISHEGDKPLPSSISDETLSKLWQSAPIIVGWTHGGGYLVVSHRRPSSWVPVRTEVMGSLNITPASSPKSKTIKYSKESSWIEHCGAADSALKCKTGGGYANFGIDCWSLVCGVPLETSLLSFASAIPLPCKLQQRLIHLKKEENASELATAASILRSFWWGRVNACISSRAASLVSAESKDSCFERLSALASTNGKYDEALEFNLFIGSYAYGQQPRNKTSQYCSALKILVGQQSSPTLLLNFAHSLFSKKGLGLLPWLWHTEHDTSPHLITVIQSKCNSAFYIPDLGSEDMNELFDSHANREGGSVVYMALGEWSANVGESSDESDTDSISERISDINDMEEDGFGDYDSSQDNSDDMEDHDYLNIKLSSIKLPFLFIPMMIERVSSTSTSFVAKACGSSIINPLILADTGASSVISRLISGHSQSSTSKQDLNRAEIINLSTLTHLLKTGEVLPCCSLVSPNDPLSCDEISPSFPLGAFRSPVVSGHECENPLQSISELISVQQLINDWVLNCFCQSMHLKSVSTSSVTHLVDVNTSCCVASVLFDLNHSQKAFVDSVLDNNCGANSISLQRLEGLPGSGRTTSLVAAAVASSLSSIPTSHLSSNCVTGSCLFIGPRHKALLNTASYIESKLLSKSNRNSSSAGGDSLVLVLSHDDASRVVNAVHDLIASLTLEAGKRKDDKHNADELLEIRKKFAIAKSEHDKARSQFANIVPPSSSSDSEFTQVGLLALNRIETLRSNEEKCACGVLGATFSTLRSDIFSEANQSRKQRDSQRNSVLSSEQSDHLAEAMQLIKSFIRKHGNLSLTSASLINAQNKAGHQDLNETCSGLPGAVLTSVGQVMAASLDLKNLVTHPGWHLAVGMFPVVLATPASLSKWLPSYFSATTKAAVSPKWKLAMVDDSTMLPWYSMSSVISRASCIVVSGGNSDFGKSLFAKKSFGHAPGSAQALATACSYAVASEYVGECTKLSQSYMSNEALNSLPLSSTVESVLKGKDLDEPLVASRSKGKKLDNDNDIGSLESVVSPIAVPRVRVVCHSKWHETRIGSRLDSSLDCLSRVLGSVLRYNQSPSLIKSCKKSISDKAAMMGTAYEAIRKLRCAWVNEEEAAAIIAESWSIQNSLCESRVCVVAMSPAQALLIDTCLQLIYTTLASSDQFRTNKVIVGISTDVGCLNMNPDVLLISFTHSITSNSTSRRGNGAGKNAVKRSVDAVSFLVKWGARFQIIVFVSSGSISLHRRAIERGLVASTASLFASLGKMLLRPCSSVGNSKAPKVCQDWVDKFYECILSASNDQSFQGTEFKLCYLSPSFNKAALVTNFDSAVICHMDSKELSKNEDYVFKYFVELPNYLSNFGWKRVLHAFQSEIGGLSISASSLNFSEVAISYARDLCSWRTVLSDLLELRSINSTSAVISMKSSFEFEDDVLQLKSSISTPARPRLSSIVPSLVFANIHLRVRDVTVLASTLTMGRKGQGMLGSMSASKPWLKIGKENSKSGGSLSSSLLNGDRKMPSINISSAIASMEKDEETRMMAYEQAGGGGDDNLDLSRFTAVHVLGLKPGRSYLLELIDGRNGIVSQAHSLQTLTLEVPSSPPSVPRLINVALIPNPGRGALHSAVVLSTIEENLNDETAQIKVVAKGRIQSCDDEEKFHTIESSGIISHCGEVLQLTMSGFRAGHLYEFNCSARNASMIPRATVGGSIPTKEIWIHSSDSMELLVKDEMDNVVIFEAPSEESSDHLMFDDDEEGNISEDEAEEQNNQNASLGDSFSDIVRGEDDESSNSFLQDDPLDNQTSFIEETKSVETLPIPLRLILLPAPCGPDHDDPGGDKPLFDASNYAMLSVVGLPTNGEAMNAKGIDVDVRGWNASKSACSWCRVVKAQKPLADSDVDESESSSQCQSINFPLETLLAPYAAALVNLSVVSQEHDLMTSCYQVRVRSVVWPQTMRSTGPVSSEKKKKKHRHISGSWSTIVIAADKMSKGVVAIVTDIFNAARLKVAAMKREADLKLAREIASLPAPPILLSQLRLKNRKSVADCIVKRLSYDATKVLHSQGIKSPEDKTTPIKGEVLSSSGVNIELVFNTEESTQDEEDGSGWDIELQFRCGLNIQVCGSDNSDWSIEIPLCSRAHKVDDDHSTPSDDQDQHVYGSMLLPYYNDNTHVILQLSFAKNLELLNESREPISALDALHAAYAASGMLQLPHKQSMQMAGDSYEAFINIEVLSRRVQSLSKQASSKKQSKSPNHLLVASNQAFGEWSVLDARALRLPEQTASTPNFNIAALNKVSSPVDELDSGSYVHPLAAVAARLLLSGSSQQDPGATHVDESSVLGGQVSNFKDLERRFSFLVDIISNADAKAAAMVLSFFKTVKHDEDNAACLTSLNHPPVLRDIIWDIFSSFIGIEISFLRQKLDIIDNDGSHFYSPFFGDKSVIASALKNALLDMINNPRVSVEEKTMHEYAKSLVYPIEYLLHLRTCENIKGYEMKLHALGSSPLPNISNIRHSIVSEATDSSEQVELKKYGIGVLPSVVTSGLDDWGRSWFLPKLQSCFSVNISSESPCQIRQLSSSSALMELVAGAAVDVHHKKNQPEFCVSLRRKMASNHNESDGNSSDLSEETTQLEDVDCESKQDFSNKLIFNASQSGSGTCASLGSCDVMYFLGFGDVISEDGSTDVTSFAYLPVNISPTTVTQCPIGDESLVYSITSKLGHNLFFNPTLTMNSCEYVAEKTSIQSQWTGLPIAQWMSLILKNDTLVSAYSKVPSSKKEHTVDCKFKVKPSVRLFSLPSNCWPPSPQLSVLMYHGTWLRASQAYGLVSGCLSNTFEISPEKQAAEGNDSKIQWSFDNPLQIGPCDASQRRAISLALAGESFVLRGPPGCGKTQTLATMTSALVAAGKRVLVVAKMPVALTCFEDKVKRMTSGDIGCNALGCLTSGCFLRRSGGTFRNSSDPLHAVAHEPRIVAFKTRLHMAAFWSNLSDRHDNDGDYAADTECCIREMLRGGEAVLSNPQPESLLSCVLGEEASVLNMVGEWVPCAELLVSNNATGPAQKKLFVCGLCGLQKPKEASFLDHMAKHSNLSLWEKHYASRILRSHIPNNAPSVSAIGLTGAKSTFTSTINQNINLHGGLDNGAMSETFETPTNSLLKAEYEAAKARKGELQDYLAKESSFRVQLALKDKEALDDRLQYLEEMIQKSWRLLSTSVHELYVKTDNEIGSINEIDQVVPSDTTFLNLLSSILSGASFWQEGACSGLCSNPYHESFFTSKCIPFIRCGYCYKASGKMLSETVRLLSSSQVPSFATATTLMLRLIKEVDDIKKRCSVHPSRCGAACCIDLITALASAFHLGEDCSEDEFEVFDSHSTRYQVLQQRCKLVLFMLELRWFSNHFLAYNNQQQILDDSALETVCTLQQSMIEVAALELRRQEVCLQLLSASSDEKLFHFLANPTHDLAILSGQKMAADLHISGLELINSLDNALNPKNIKDRSAVFQRFGHSQAGSTSGNGTSINKVAAQQGIWRLLKEQAFAESLLDQSEVADRIHSMSETSAECLFILLQRLFPVMCLTPEEVAHHIPASLFASSPYGECRPVFDVVLFDEASQLPTLEALPCLGRAAQCVVVGDDKQLPPRDASVIGLLDECLRGNETKVPSRESSQLSPLNLDVSKEDDVEVMDVPSIDDDNFHESTSSTEKAFPKTSHSMAKLPLIPLTVHYRSGHQSLIAVSNELFYNGSLGSFPSAHCISHRMDLDKGSKSDRMKSSGLTSSGGGHGLVKVEVDAGIMESNNGKRDKFASFIFDAVRVHCGLAAEDINVSYSASPQGYVNLSQAEGVFKDVILYFSDISKHNKPMSLGIITLNRPQRALLHSFVQASQKQFGLMSLSEASSAKNAASLGKAASSSLNGFVREESHRHPNDEVLFIQSIDQIQGEEREVILFSTLLAPRHATISQNGGPRNMNEAESDDEDGFDPLEQLEEDGVDSDSDEDAGNQSYHHKRQPVRALGLSYSTLAHAHGERLLNVGLTRAVRRMSVYYHPRMPAAPEHDPKPGKRSFGWLVRYLLKKSPSCPCTACASRFQRLCEDTDDSDIDSSTGRYGQACRNNEAQSTHADTKTFVDILSRVEHKHTNEPVANWGRFLACNSVYESSSTIANDVGPGIVQANVNSTLDVGQGRFKVDVGFCVSSTWKPTQEVSNDSIQRLPESLRMKKIAMLCCERHSTSGKVDVRERCSVVPTVLSQSKLGWDECLPFASLSAVFKPLIDEQPKDFDIIKTLECLTTGINDAFADIKVCSRLTAKGFDKVGADDAREAFALENSVDGTIAWMSNVCDTFENVPVEVDISSLAIVECGIVPPKSKPKRRVKPQSESRTMDENISDEAQQTFNRLNKLKKSELQDELRKLGLAVSGLKSELVSRLLHGLNSPGQGSKTEEEVASSDSDSDDQNESIASCGEGSENEVSWTKQAEAHGSDEEGNPSHEVGVKESELPESPVFSSTVQITDYPVSPIGGEAWGGLSISNSSPFAQKAFTPPKRVNRNCVPQGSISRIHSEFGASVPHDVASVDVQRLPLPPQNHKPGKSLKEGAESKHVKRVFLRGGGGGESSDEDSGSSLDSFIASECEEESSYSCESDIDGEESTTGKNSSIHDSGDSNQGGEISLEQSLQSLVDTDEEG